MSCKEVIDKLLRWISEEAKDAMGLVVPISGGTDGALALWLCAQVLGPKVKGVHFRKDRASSLRCLDWFEKTAPIEYISMFPIPEMDNEIYRWALTASFCLERSFWPVGSRNRSEQELGTYSRASCYATFFPIQGIWKSDVMRLCDHIGVPDEVLLSSRRPDPPCGREVAFANIGIEKVDVFLQVACGIRPLSNLTALSEGEIRYLTKLHASNRFKENVPVVGPKILLSSRATC